MYTDTAVDCSPAHDARGCTIHAPGHVMYDQSNWDNTRRCPPSPKWNGRAAALVPAAYTSGQKSAQAHARHIGAAAPCLGIEVSLPGRRHDTNLSEALGKLLDGVPNALRSWRLPVQGLKNLGGLGLVWALGPNTSSPPGAKLPRVEVEHPPALAANTFYFHTICTTRPLVPLHRQLDPLRHA